MANKNKKTPLERSQSPYDPTVLSRGTGTNWYQQAYDAAKGGAGEGGGFGSIGYQIDWTGIDFGKSDFAKNVNHMQQDHMEIDLNGLPISGNGSFIGNLMQYLKSVGKDNMVSNKNLQKFEQD